MSFQTGNEVISSSSLGSFWDQPKRIVQNDGFGLPLQYVEAIISTSYYKSSDWLQYFVRYILPSAQSLPVNQYFVSSSNVVSQCTLLWYLLYSLGQFSSTLFLHWANLLRSTPVASTEVFGNLVRWLYRIIRCCVPVASQDLSNNISFASVKQNAINGVFAQYIWDFFYRSLTSALVEYVLLLVDSSVRSVYELSLFEFCGGRPCISVQWDGIRNSVFIVRYGRQRCFDNIWKSYLRGPQLVVLLSCQKLSSGCSHWWPVEEDVLPCGKEQWQLAKFTIPIVSVSSLRRFYSLLRILAHCCNAV